jgi:hypothetical protein
MVVAAVEDEWIEQTLLEIVSRWSHVLSSGVDFVPGKWYSGTDRLTLHTFDR